MEQPLTNINQNENTEFFRFQVFQGVTDQDGTVRKTKSVGMAYLKEGHQIITLRLWTFVSERFYLLLNNNDASKYLVMTREPNRSPKARNKYFWNIVGNGTINSAKGMVQLDFDLFDKPVYMNLHPESVATSKQMPEPTFIEDAA